MRTILSIILISITSFACLAQSNKVCFKTINNEKTFGVNVKFAYPCEMIAMEKGNVATMLIKTDPDNMMAYTAIITVTVDPADSEFIKIYGFRKFIDTSRVKGAATTTFTAINFPKIDGIELAEEMYEYIKVKEDDTAFSNVVRYTIPYNGKIVRLSFVVASPVASREKVNNYFINKMALFKECSEHLKVFY